MSYGGTKDGKYLCVNCAIPPKEKQRDSLFDDKYQKHLKNDARKKAKKKRDDWYIPKDKFFEE